MLTAEQTGEEVKPMNLNYYPCSQMIPIVHSPYIDSFNAVLSLAGNIPASGLVLQRQLVVFSGST